MAPRTQLALEVLIGTTARLVLAAVTSYRAADANPFAGWAEAMRDHPLRDFYAEAPRPDHLPGDLWVLKGLQVLFTGAGGNDVAGSAFEFVTNVVPVLADVLVGVLVYLIVRRWRSEGEAARAARWYLLNPAVIVLAAAWGQWDALSVVLLLVGVAFLVGKGPWWVAAAPPFGWGVLAKPELAVPVGVLLLWTLVRPDRPWGSSARSLAMQAGVSAGLAVAAAGVLLEPFRVGLARRVHGGWSLVERIQYAAELHPFTTMGAPNIWMIVDRSVIGGPDDVVRWAGLAPVHVGAIALVLAWGLVGRLAARSSGRAAGLQTLVWSAAAAMFASCLVLTRVPERYYFPVLVLFLLWGALRHFDGRAVVMFWSFSFLFLIDLLTPMGWTGGDHGLLHHPGVLIAVGLLHCAFFFALLCVQVASGRPGARAGGPSATRAARRTAPG